MAELLLVHDAHSIADRDVVATLAAALRAEGHQVTPSWELRGVSGGFVAAVAAAARSAAWIVLVDPAAWWKRGGSLGPWQREILEHVRHTSTRCAVIVDARRARVEQDKPFDRLVRHVLPEQWSDLCAWLEREPLDDAQAQPPARRRPALVHWPVPSADDPLSSELVELLEHEWTQMLTRAGQAREGLYTALGLLCAALEPLPWPLFKAALAVTPTLPISPTWVEDIAGRWLKHDKGGVGLIHPAIPRFVDAELGNAEIDAHLRLIDAMSSLRETSDLFVQTYVERHARVHLMRCHGLVGDAIWVADVDVLTQLAASGHLVAKLEPARAMVGEDFQGPIELMTDVARRHEHRFSKDPSSLPARLWTELIGRGVPMSWVREQMSWREQLPVVRLSTPLAQPDCSTRVFIHEHQVCACAIDAKAEWALSGTSRGQLRLWSLRSGLEVASFGLGTWIQACVITPDGTRGVACFDRTVVLLDLERHSELARHDAHGDDVACVAVSADGRTVLSADEAGDVVVWRVDRDRHDRMGSHGARVRNCAMSDDARLAITGDENDQARIWDVEAGAQLHALTGHAYDVNAVSITPDGARAVSLCINHARVWAPREGRLLHKHESMGMSARKGVLVEGGKRLLVADYGEAVHRWRVDDGKLEARHIAHSEDIMDIAATPDGAWYLTCGNDHALRLWQREAVTAAGLQAAPVSPRSITALEPASDGVSVWVSSGYDGVRRLGVDGGAQLAEVGGGTAYGIAESDGRLVLVGSRHCVDVYDVAGGKLLARWEPTSDWLRAVVVEPGGRRLAYAGDAGVVYCSTFEGAELIELRASTDWVRALGWVGPDRLVSVDDDGAFRVWDVAQRKCIVESQPAKSAAIHALALDRHGDRAAVGDSCGHLVIVDIESGEPLSEIEGQTSKISALAWARDDRVLISAGEDATLRVWEAVDGRELARFDAPFAMTRVTVVGRHIVAGDVAGNVMSLEVDWHRLGMK